MKTYRFAMLIGLAVAVSSHSVSRTQVSSHYETLQDIASEYRMHIFIEPGNHSIRWQSLANDLELDGWSNVGTHHLPDEDSIWRDVRIFAPPDSSMDSSIVLIEHEAGIELLAMRITGYFDGKDFLTLLQKVAILAAQRLGAPIYDRNTGQHHLSIVLKGRNWEFTSTGMPLGRVAEIQQLLEPYR